MRLNLGDPHSIAAWFRVAPARHGTILRAWLKSEMHREFWPAIAAARELVRSSAS